MALIFTTSYIEDSKAIFHQYKKLAEAAMAQVTDKELVATLDPEMNCIAQIVKHMAGNMRSRWTEFLTTDGEKPTRNRDSEFEEPPSTREELMALWEEGWGCVFTALEPLTECRPYAHCHHSRRGALGDAGHQSAGGALREPLRADHLPGQASAIGELEMPECAEEEVHGVQPEGSRGGGQPAVTLVETQVRSVSGVSMPPKMRRRMRAKNPGDVICTGASPAESANVEFRSMTASVCCTCARNCSTSSAHWRR